MVSSEQNTFYQAKTDGTAPSMQENHPIPKLFFTCSSLKWRDQTSVEFVIKKCSAVSLQIPWNHCSLKDLTAGKLKNLTFLAFGPVDPLWLHRWTQENRFCVFLFSLIVKKSMDKITNSTKCHTPCVCIWYSSLTHLVFTFSYRGLPKQSTIYEFGLCPSLGTLQLNGLTPGSRI